MAVRLIVRGRFRLSGAIVWTRSTQASTMRMAFMHLLPEG